jgi:hypothetical protein
MKPCNLRSFLTSEVRRTNGQPTKLLALFVLGASACLSFGQIQTAGTVFVNIDATTLSPGALSGNDIANSGTLGGVFESTNTSFIAPAGGVNALVLSGTNYLRLMAAHAGALIAPPLGLVGTNATCSIEVWAFNPQVAGDESIIAWGARAAGQNMAFEYGNGTSGGAQHNAADIAWDPVAGGCPLNNRWHHLVYTFDGANQNLYADGVLANSQPVSFNTATNQGIAMGAQWATAAATFPGATPALATLAIARIRVHDDALTPAQVLNNYNVEKVTFVPAAITAAFLTAGPVHRYSFNEPATNDAIGLTVHDSIGGADGIVQGSEANEVPSFSSRRLLLPGGIQTTAVGYGAPYVDLPNGLVSVNSTNNGGAGELSIEIWYKNTGGYPPTATGNGPWAWSRVFDIGSCGLTSDQQGIEVTSTGGYPSGAGQLDYLIYAAQVGQGYSCVNQRQLAWQNKDVNPAGSTTNTFNVAFSVQTMGTYLTDRHVVVTWKENTGQIIAYENGLQVASITASNAMSALNDINVWLGRSQSGSDSGLAGEYDEARFYNYVLSPEQVVGDFQVGPNTINIGEQSPAISVQPQSASVNQGWSASFSISASGSPACSYQWTRNGTPIPGATSDTYFIAAVALTNNGDTFSCTVSNFAGAIPHVVNSSGAPLTVLPNVAIPSSVLHETKEPNPTAATSGQRDNYSGVVGAIFQAGSAGAVVTHLGFEDVYGDGLNVNHRVGLFSADGSTIVGYVTVPPGPDPGTYLTNGYRYVALTNPVLLAPNTSYILEAETFNNDGDMWADVWIPALWNPYFVGTNNAATRQARFAGAWPSPATGASSGNGSYGAPNMAVLAVGPAQVWAQQSNVVQYVGLPVTLSVIANGQAPLSLQWYKAPSTLLPGQISTSLVFTNPQTSDSGSYYAVASGSGSATSSNINLSILVNTPVNITMQPTNTTVPEGYGAAFYISASGTPPISYQWQRNGAAVAGATNTSYLIAAASMTNDGDLYSCVVSNRTTSANTATSQNATLTVQPNRAPVAQILYPPIAGFRDDFSGTVGGIFQVGNAPATVTHLGFYSSSGNLNATHHVSIFPANGGAPIASVQLPDANSYFTNNYVWLALTTPLTLAPNTSYILGAEVYALDGDAWPDVSAPSSWNPYYVGANGPTSRGARFTGAFYPSAPTGASSANSIYGAPNLGLLPVGLPIVAMQQNGATQYVGSAVTFSAFVDGEPPLTVQWYKSPGTLLNGQTNTTLTLSNLAVGDSGDYYLLAANGQGSTQGSNATLAVISQGPPTITQQPQSISAYPNQQVTFAVGVAVAPLSYQWSFNATAIPGATNSSLTLVGITTNNAGNYQVAISNSFGATNSALAALNVITPPAGSYLAAVINAQPLIYFRFSDVTNGNAAANFGSLGLPYNGTYEGAFIDTPGPQPPAFPNFESTNDSLALDGLTVDVSIPVLNVSTNSGPNLTVAAWINANGVQNANAGIIFSRGSVASGLGIKHDANNPGVDMLEYHWNSLYFQSNSFLDLPTNQWVFTALTIAPNQAIIYLHDGVSLKTWTNNSPHAPVAFDNISYVGWDNNDASRRFNGAIDEPMIFGRTLSPSEISNIYQAAVTPPTVTLHVDHVGANVVVTWPNGTLQQADQVTGPYTDMTGVTSPYTNSPSGPMKFYRVKVQ